jgi:hypothetical protein
VSESDEECNIPRRKLDAVRAISESRPNLIGELLDDILSEHPAEPSPALSWYGTPRLAVLDEKLPVASRPDPDGAKSSPRRVSGRILPHETSDDYPTVAMLDAKTRVIECAAGIQWIIQRRRGRGWESRLFFRTKEGLLLYAKPVTPELLALPDYFPERSDSKDT